MKRKEYSVLLAGLMALGLVACKSTPTAGETYTSAPPSSSTSSMGTASTTETGTPAGASPVDMTQSPASQPATGATGASGAYGTGTTAGTASPPMEAAGQAPAATGQSMTVVPNSTVTSIEVVQRPAGAGTTGTGAMAGAAAGGTAGAPMTGDRVYRITLRMDDGRTQVVTQEWAPSFSTGDRVRVMSGAIQREQR